ncbi:serine hydrolase [Alkalihalobacillus sp. AL-G]|uniref:serine hydrolase domain-containing protein n=1 Tax=Alkalihalobacillus sp. AL-G TaxID=2926399 RepID=UPI00272B64D1|nr:serine hydrolase domain-containing protein [Alkalihalobacillus sp. AL-G]WLD94604.1 beta-lactamase family protein [Alkalihalobacillus sp. AL-G]
MNKQNFEEHIKRWMKGNHVPGMAVGIKKDGELIYQKGFGLRDIDKKLPVDEHTVFGTASVTKSLTAAAVLLLAEEGKLSLNDPVANYLPEMRDIVPETQLDKLKVFHLLSHSTGLAPVERKESINRLRNHLSYLKETEKVWFDTPGETFSYSNDMFLLTGLIIERLTGESYREYTTRTFLNPLGMSRSTFNIQDLEEIANVTIPYDFVNEQHVRCEWPKLGNYEVGGGLRSNVNDMLKYGHYLLQENLAERLAVPRVRLLMGQSYGHGVQVRQYDGKYTLIEHSGGQPGVSSHFGVIPEANLSAVVLTNVGGVNASSVWLKLINAGLGIPSGQQRFNYEPITLPQQRLDTYIGEYSSKEGSQVEITVQENELQVKSDKKHYRTQAIGNHIFIDEKEHNPIKFYMDETENQAWGVLFGSRILHRVN